MARLFRLTSSEINIAMCLFFPFFGYNCDGIVDKYKSMLLRAFFELNAVLLLIELSLAAPQSTAMTNNERLFNAVQ